MSRILSTIPLAQGTAPEVIAAYIVGGVALVAVLGSVITTWLTLKHQRALMVDDRIWRARSEIYVRILNLTLYKGGDELSDARLTDELEDAAAKVEAFASDEVVSIFHALLRTSEMPVTDEEERYTRAERIGIRIDDLMTIVRDELQGRRYRRPWRNRLPLPEGLRRRLEQRAWRKGLSA